MRVLSVIHYPTYGGPHNRNAAVAPVMRQRGIDITVLVPDQPGNAAQLLREHGVTTIQLPLSRLRAVRDAQTHWTFVRGFRSDVGRLRTLIRDLEIDLVLVNGLVNPHSAIAAHLEGVPVVWQILDTFAPVSLRRVMMPLVTSIADAIMSTGRAVAAAHPRANSFGERLVFFFPVADTKRFVNSDETRRRARDRLGISHDPLVIGSVGNINPMKGHDIFIRAAARIRRSRPGTRFVILGAQSSSHAQYADGLWRMASELGLELGRDLLVVDPGIDVPGTAASFDVFWLTSNPRSEGIPTVIGEAMALSLPVVASNVGSVCEALEDSVTGTLVAPRDPDALVNATLPYLDDPRLRDAVGHAGRARAERLYSAEVCADRHEQAFEMAARHRRQHRARSVVP